jgi:hypothetical protein
VELAKYVQVVFFGFPLFSEFFISFVSFRTLNAVKRYSYECKINPIQTAQRVAVMVKIAKQIPLRRMVLEKHEKNKLSLLKMMKESKVVQGRIENEQAK